MTVNNLDTGNQLIEFDNVVKEFKAKKNGVKIKFNAVDGVSLKLNAG